MHRAVVLPAPKGECRQNIKSLSATSACITGKSILTTSTPRWLPAASQPLASAIRTIVGASAHVVEAAAGLLDGHALIGDATPVVTALRRIAATLPIVTAGLAGVVSRVANRIGGGAGLATAAILIQATARRSGGTSRTSSPGLTPTASKAGGSTCAECAPGCEYCDRATRGRRRSSCQLKASVRAGAVGTTGLWRLEVLETGNVGATKSGNPCGAQPRKSPERKKRCFSVTARCWAKHGLSLRELLQCIDE